ncbi:unnamed protein product [Caenorhabditis brenneri]
MSEEHEEETSAMNEEVKQIEAVINALNYYRAFGKEKIAKMTPLILKSNVRDFLDICKEDVKFDDRVFSKNLSGKSQLMSHIAKVRIRFCLSYHILRTIMARLAHFGSTVLELELLAESDRFDPSWPHPVQSNILGANQLGSIRPNNRLL